MITYVHRLGDLFQLAELLPLPEEVADSVVGAVGDDALQEVPLVVFLEGAQLELMQRQRHATLQKPLKDAFYRLGTEFLGFGSAFARRDRIVAPVLEGSSPIQELHTFDTPGH